MEQLYKKNGLIFWTQAQIKLRRMFEEQISELLFSILKSENPAFSIVQVEAPILTPKDLINSSYGEEDVYILDDLVLRPETTMGSYEYAKYILSGYHNPKYRTPITVWQHGKSFRREQDQSTKFMRLKEFYQLEFQIIYATNTANDYSLAIIPGMESIISSFIGACRNEPSDRLPSYSERTIDIICSKTNMEVCSISKRTDFNGYKVLEVAVGTDRLIYNFQNK